MKKVTRITVKADKCIRTSGYNPYQTGHGVFEDKKNKRSYRKQELRKLIAEY